MEEKKELLDQDERVVEIELERLRGFVNHPFKVQADSQMIELQESIKKYGILNPLIVRPRQDGTYEIISGHRRKFAAEKIGYRKVPVIIRVYSPSYVLTAMGLDADRISSAIRISWGAHTDKDELINELSELIAVAKSLVF